VHANTHRHHQDGSAIDPDTAIEVRDRAVILLGYASALRPGDSPRSTSATSSPSRPPYS